MDTQGSSRIPLLGQGTQSLKIILDAISTFHYLNNMTNTNTNTTARDTHALIDIEECELLCAGSLSDAMAHIAEWNASEGTAYASVEEFNRGEEFYRIVSLPEPALD